MNSLWGGSVRTIPRLPPSWRRGISELISTSVVESDGNTLKLACSIGMAASEPYDRTVESLIERADHALYVAKAHGRGQVRWFGAEEALPLDHDTPDHLAGANGK